ncbi:MAG: M23 family metallopeptidase [Litorimonas sp.]
MKRLAIAAILLVACSVQPEAEAQIAPVEAQEQPTKPEIKSVQDLLTQVRADAEANGQTKTVTTDHDAWPAKPQLNCHGITKQGGMVICQTAPNARVEVGRAENDTYVQTADANGVIIIGFDRDEPAAFARVGERRVNFTIEPREYDTSVINGLPRNMVNEYSESDLKRIRAATARKKVGFASKVEEIGFKDGFIYPVTDHIKTTNFGAQRILNGEPKRPHFGVDLAAPKGTPILAPADGIVSMADDDMYFEGSLMLIDHGQGLISYYLHNEDVMVTEGQRVVQGEQIGTVGSRGRSTGPHLCWRLKWRGRNLDPELLTEWPTHG